jgi:hypothetical protein
MDKKELLKKAEIALLDILRGYSILNTGKESLYFKHFSLIDSLIFEEEYYLSLASAKKSGIKDEQQIIDDAIKSKKWSIQKEEQIKSLIWTIDKLSIAAKKISDPYQKRSAENSVNLKQQELSDIQKDRSEICSFSAESFAQNKKIKKIISHCLYEDLDFTKKIEDHPNTYYYNTLFFEKISQLNDQRIVLTAAYNTSFFEVFCLNYRTPHILLKNVGMEMTIFQKNLLVYANSLLNKLKNTNIPEAIMEDPVKVLNYKEPEKDNGKKTSVGTDDLKEKMAKNGGKLNPEDLIS